MAFKKRDDFFYCIGGLNEFLKKEGLEIDDKTLEDYFLKKGNERIGNGFSCLLSLEDCLSIIGVGSIGEYSNDKFPQFKQFTDFITGSIQLINNRSDDNYSEVYDPETKTCRYKWKGNDIFKVIFDRFNQEDLNEVDRLYRLNKDFFKDYYVRYFSGGNMHCFSENYIDHVMPYRWTSSNPEQLAFFEKNDPGLRLEREIEAATSLEELKNSNTIKQMHYEIMSSYVHDCCNCFIYVMNEEKEKKFAGLIDYLKVQKYGEDYKKEQEKPVKKRKLLGFF